MPSWLHIMCSTWALLGAPQRLGNFVPRHPSCLHGVLQSGYRRASIRHRLLALSCHSSINDEPIDQPRRFWLRTLSSATFRRNCLWLASRLWCRRRRFSDASCLWQLPRSLRIHKSKQWSHHLVVHRLLQDRAGRPARCLSPLALLQRQPCMPVQVVVLSRSPSLQQAPGCGTPPVPPSFPSLGANTGPFSVGSPRALTPQASNGPLAGGFISSARMRPGHLAHGDRSVQVHSGQPVVGHMSPRTMTHVGFANPHHPAQMHLGQPAAGMTSPPRMRSTGSPSSVNSGRARWGMGAQDLHGSVFVRHPRNAEDHALSARTERLQERLGALSALGLTNVRSL
mmetsp:Transcript_11651/g.41601  ORF Transcript_11651/g.41601 Transcript_11651/m.41601 type:complete len:340 (-) Transcript_11651:45-1064(-)